MSANQQPNQQELSDEEFMKLHAKQFYRTHGQLIGSKPQYIPVPKEYNDNGKFTDHLLMATMYCCVINEFQIILQFIFQLKISIILKKIQSKNSYLIVSISLNYKQGEQLIELGESHNNDMKQIKRKKNKKF